jgi:hypothetical protein
MEYTYDSNNNKIQTLNYFRDTTLDVWDIIQKQEYTYDTNGNVLLNMNYIWDENTSDWVNDRKNLYAYDSNGKPILDERYEWDTNLNDWWGNFKGIRVYNSYGNLIADVRYGWDSNTSDWIEDSKAEWELVDNSYPRATLMAMYNWDSNVSSFVPYMKMFMYYEKFLYNERDTICPGDSLLWRGQYLKTEGVFADQYFSVTSRDSIYEITLSLHSAPSPFSITGATSVSSNETTSYTVPDNSNVTYSWIINNGTILSYPNAYSAESQWGNTGEGWIKAFAEDQNGCRSDTSVLLITITATGIDEINNNGINIFPNPASTLVTIETLKSGLTYQLVNSTGEVVMNGILESSHKQIDISNLSKGIYFLNIENKRVLKVIKR